MRLIPLSAPKSPLAADLAGETAPSPTCADSGAGTGWSDRAPTSLPTQVREHLARGVGQAREDVVRGGMWGFVPHLPSTQVKLRAPTDHLVPFCRNEGLPFLPRHGSRQRWTGHGNEKHGVLGSMSSDPRAYAPGDPVLISLGPSRHAIPY